MHWCSCKIKSEQFKRFLCVDESVFFSSKMQHKPCARLEERKWKFSRFRLGDGEKTVRLEIVRMLQVVALCICKTSFRIARPEHCCQCLRIGVRRISGARYTNFFLLGLLLFFLNYRYYYRNRHTRKRNRIAALCIRLWSCPCDILRANRIRDTIPIGL